MTRSVDAVQRWNWFYQKSRLRATLRRILRPGADVSWRRRKWHMRQTKIVVTRYGGPEVITVAEQECPAPMGGEVQVKILAAGVSLPDVLAREGIHPETPRVPYTPGWGLVGIVDQLGEGVSGFALGKTVAAMP